jgi:hypothetical protein
MLGIGRNLFDSGAPFTLFYRFYSPSGITTGKIGLSTMVSKNKDFEYALLAGEEDGEGTRSSIEIKQHHHSRWYARMLRGALYLVVGISLLFNFILWLSSNKEHALGDQSVTAYGM